MGSGERPGAPADAAPTEAKVESRRTVSACPSGHVAGAEDSAIERFSAKTVSQVRQRNS